MPYSSEMISDSRSWLNACAQHFRGLVTVMDENLTNVAEDSPTRKFSDEVYQHYRELNSLRNSLSDTQNANQNLSIVIEQAKKTLTDFQHRIADVDPRGFARQYMVPDNEYVKFEHLLNQQPHVPSHPDYSDIEGVANKHISALERVVEGLDIEEHRGTVNLDKAIAQIAQDMSGFVVGTSWVEERKLEIAHLKNIDLTTGDSNAVQRFVDAESMLAEKLGSRVEKISSDLRWQVCTRIP